MGVDNSRTTCSGWRVVKAVALTERDIFTKRGHCHKKDVETTGCRPEPMTAQ